MLILLLAFRLFRPNKYPLDHLDRLNEHTIRNVAWPGTAKDSANLANLRRHGAIHAHRGEPWAVHCVNLAGASANESSDRIDWRARFVVADCIGADSQGSRHSAQILKCECATHDASDEINLNDSMRPISIETGFGASPRAIARFLREAASLQIKLTARHGYIGPAL